MNGRHTVFRALALAMSVALGAACGGDAGDVRETDEDAQRRAGKLALGDTLVLEALKDPRGPGRIIYEAPTDLSLANARRTRPDLVKPDTTRRDTSRTARRDTTAGDASSDTSGGAARPRRP